MTNNNANTSTISSTISEEARIWAKCETNTIDSTMSIAVLKFQHHGFWSGMIRVVPFHKDNFWPGTWANWIKVKEMGVLIEEPLFFTKKELVSYLETNYDTWVKENCMVFGTGLGNPPGTIPRGVMGESVW